MQRLFLRTRIIKAIHILLNPGCWRAVLLKVYPSFEHIKLSNYLSEYPIDVIFDVGANVGQFSVFSSLYLNRAPIYSFEPLPISYNKLRLIANLYPDIRPYNLALGDKNEKSLISFGSQLDSSSMLSFSPILKSIYGISDTGRSVLVDTQRGETFIQNLCLGNMFNQGLLKIDVQGYELEVLRGIEKFISSFAFIYVELSFVELYHEQPSASEVISFLFQRGFDVVSIFNNDLQSNGTSHQADFLFKRLTL